jgi:GT2 family glycosyltransferase
LISKKYPEVHLIKNEKNLGFGSPNNHAASLSTGEFLLFLNPDMRVTLESLDIMVQWMRAHTDVGLASCKLIDEKGNLNADAQPRRFPRILDQLAIVLKIHHIFPKILNNYMFKDFDADKEQEVDSVRGSFMVMRREVFQKLGWAFDPRYFIWFEDVDLCREVKRLDYKVAHTPIISCVDYVGQSFKQRTTLWKQKNFTKSMLTYFQKWEPWYKWIWIAIFRPVGIAMAWVNDKIKI